MSTDRLALVILLVVKGLAYGITAGVLIRRRGWKETLKEPLTASLGLYAAATGVWSVVQILGQGLAWGGALSPEGLARLSLYEGFCLYGIFLYLSQAFLRLDLPRRWWQALGAWLALTLFLEANLLPLKGGWPAFRPGLIFALLILGCALVTGLTFWLTLMAARRTQQPLHLNRILHWVANLGLILVGSTLVFAHLPQLGTGLKILALPLLLYATLSHNLRDIRQMIRLGLNYLVATGVVAVGYVALYTAASLLGRRLPSLEGWRLWGALALISALLSAPLVALGQKVAQRLLSRQAYDPNRILGEYGLSISNILDLDKLATVAIGLISEAMEIQHGTLFVVDLAPETDQGPAYYRLRGVGGLGAQTPPEGQLALDNPLTNYLRDERCPLTQYDIDLLPQFRTIPAEARAWLGTLNMDVYVPIYTKNAWIGLLGLGPKLSRNRYFDEDLALLGIFADHTAVALENARLVEGLQRLNEDLSRAYAELDQANHLLAQLDRAKSEFINIISHELGTPLMHLDSYNQLIHDDVLVQHSADLQEFTHGMEKSIRRMYEIVETMLDTAKLDTHTLELQLAPVPLLEPIVAVCEDLKPALNARRLALEIKNLRNLPTVPADRAALRKVFYQLIINAIKYTPDGGKITLMGARVENLPPVGEGVDITVTDTGIGIAPKDLELIFLKFYQTGEVDLHSTDKTKFKGGGPGLGLTIVRGIVEAHGGKVWAESPGCDEQRCPGSRFHVCLPLRPPAPPARKA